MRKFSVVSVRKTSDGRDVFRVFTVPVVMVKQAIEFGNWSELQKWDITDLLNWEIVVENGEAKISNIELFAPDGFEIDPDVIGSIVQTAE